MSYEIKKGVPIPQIAGRGKPKKECPYPFGEMSIGDSFEVTCDLAKVNHAYADLHGWKHKHRKASGNKAFDITTRRIEGGLGVWRTS
jgi:hypothetical protein